MKLIKPSFEILPTTGSIFEDIERASRVCYKSEENTKEGSAEKMVKFLIERGHTSMLEHGTVYLNIPPTEWKIADDYKNNKYSTVRMGERFYYTTTNYRVLIENDWLHDLQYQCEPTEYHEKRVSVRFICDRGVSHELVRHRVFSFAQESTRYCNYSKDKFGNELTFIIPNNNPYEDDLKHEFEEDLKNGKVLQSKCRPAWAEWIKVVRYTERCYLHFVDNGIYGISPQIARSILPNSLKTELIMTGFVSDWEGFFKLRDTSTAHPQMQELACPLHKEFKKLILL